MKHRHPRRSILIILALLMMASAGALLLMDKMTPIQLVVSRFAPPKKSSVPVSPLAYLETVVPSNAAAGAATRSRASGVSIEWVRQFGAPVGKDDFIDDIVIGPSGHLYIVGGTWGGLPGQKWVGARDIFVSKYDIHGNEQWTRQFGSRNNDYAYGLAVDGLGQTYVAGVTYGALPGQNSSGGSDAFIRKYDGMGNVIWTRQFGSSRVDGVSVDDSGYVYVAGSTTQALAEGASPSKGDAFIRKYDKDGNEVWTRQFGSSHFALGLKAATDQKGNVYVLGRVYGPLPGQRWVGGHDGFMRKYDSGGNELWTKQFGTPSDDDATSLAVDNGGNAYVAGGTAGTFPGQRYLGNGDAFITKYDTSGNEVWTLQFGSAESDRAKYVAGDSFGQIYLFGYTTGILPTKSSSSVSGSFIRKYDGSANEIWTISLGAYASSVALDGSGHIYAGGGIPTVYEPGLSARSDAFIRKYDRDGDQMWTRVFGSNSTDEANSVTVDVAGDVYVAGWTAGTFPGQRSEGFYHALVRKYDPLGNEVFTNQFGSEWAHEARSMFIDSSRQMYVVGSALEPTRWLTQGGRRNAFMYKSDSSNKPVWSRSIGWGMDGFAVGVAGDSLGTIYVVGHDNDDVFRQGSARGYDVFIQKYDARLGLVLWTRQFGSSSDDYAAGIAVDGSAYVYIVGYTNGALPGQTSSGGSDVFIRKYNSSGDEMWTRQFGSNGADQARGIAVDGGGQAYIVGWVGEALPGQRSLGGHDSFIRKYDSNGNELWTVQFGSDGNDFGSGIALDPSGGVYMVGWTDAVLAGQVSSGADDAFIRKYDGEGRELWTMQFGSGGDDHATSLAVDGSERIYVTGWTDGTLPGQTSSGGHDAFIVKLAK